MAQLSQPSQANRVVVKNTFITVEMQSGETDDSDVHVPKPLSRSNSDAFMKYGIYSPPGRESNSNMPRKARGNSVDGFEPYEENADSSLSSPESLAASPADALKKLDGAIVAIGSGESAKAPCPPLPAQFPQAESCFPSTELPYHSQYQTEPLFYYVGMYEMGQPTQPGLLPASSAQDPMAADAFGTKQVGFQIGNGSGVNAFNEQPAVQDQFAEQDLSSEWAAGFLTGAQAAAACSAALPGQLRSKKASRGAAKPQAITDKLVAFAEERFFGKPEAERDQRTTVMIKNIPNNYSRELLLELLDSMGFARCYDFVYVPIDFHRGANLGYAFVNMISPIHARQVMQSLYGFADWKACASDKVCEITWGYPLQGLEAHVQRFRNSPVMHEKVPEEFKPLLFVHGVPAPLPAPTKRLRMPRMGGTRHTE